MPNHLRLMCNGRPDPLLLFFEEPDKENTFGDLSTFVVGAVFEGKELVSRSPVEAIIARMPIMYDLVQAYIAGIEAL
ncbi:MAG: hypothetical protein ABW166_16965 [Sedimenticola sp.]